MNKRAFAIVVAASAFASAALAQISTPYGYLSTASTNSTLVKSGPGQITAMVLTNITTSAYVLKLYDLAVAPTCGTSTPKWRVSIPTSSTAGSGIAVNLGNPLQFINGIGFCITGGLPDSDSTSAAVGVSINLGIK
jgi:hypothetical protein